MNTTLIIGIYLIALASQIAVVAYIAHLYFYAKAYRLACGFLAFALALMIGRRMVPFFSLHQNITVSWFDALLAALISIFMLLGFIQFKKLLLDLECKNIALDQSSKKDSLTGALSRSETFARAEIEIERSLRDGSQVSFLMLDIDHFKNVNDRYGHLIGDAVLVNLVKKCQQQLRVIDIFGRVGGEEFFAVLPGSSREEAHQAAERLRQSVAVSVTPINQSQQISITISIGIATLNPRYVGEHDSGKILMFFFNQADIAMYRAKENGRNRIEIEG